MIYLIVFLIIFSLVIFFIWKHQKIKRLKEYRDTRNFRTPEGRFLIRAYNYKIDQLNGYKLWRKKQHAKS